MKTDSKDEFEYSFTLRDKNGKILDTRKWRTDHKSGKETIIKEFADSKNMEAWNGRIPKS